MSDDIIQIIVEPPIEVSVATAGANGLSAYEVAVVNGFVGTEQEWLVSLGVQNVAISDIEDNKLTLEADGLYVPPPQLASAQW